MSSRKTINRGKQLKLAREYRGYAQIQLADKISGLTHGQLSKFEKGFENTISDEKLREIMGFLNWPFEWLDRKSPEPEIEY